jgi:uncharacterized cupredoxin-like copper-binding protein
MKLVYFAVTAAILGSGLTYAAAATQSLEIKLQDPSTDPSVEHMRIVLDRGKVKAGRITLRAENQSKGMVHEVVIARDDGAEELPLNGNRDLVIETRVHSLGEIANIAPGMTGTLTLNLKPGAYVLFCNLPGHYLDGMVARFVVAP